jgi:hypothetical protein
VNDYNSLVPIGWKKALTLVNSTLYYLCYQRGEDRYAMGKFEFT